MRTRRRGDHRLVRVAKPLEPGPELVVEHRQLAVEDQRRGLELRECGRDVRVAAGVVDFDIGDCGPPQP